MVGDVTERSVMVVGLLPPPLLGVSSLDLAPLASASGAFFHVREVHLCQKRSAPAAAGARRGIGEPAPQSRRLGASGTFFQWVRLSAMILVDCSAAWLKVAYSTISRCTRAASLCSVSRNVCNSVMSLSISCTDVPATRCKSWLMLLATSSL